MSHGRSRLSSLDRTELQRLNVDLPAVVEATSPFVRSGTGKWHAPVTDGKTWGHCQHAVRLSGGTVEQVVVLEALANLCSNCVNAVEVPDGVEVLWQVLEKILRADARADALTAASGPRTWPAYAKALEQAARRDDAEVRSLLKPVLDHAELGAQGWQALRVWTAVVERSDQALAAYRAAAPSASATTSVTAACDAVAADRTVHEESRALGSVIGADHGYGYGRPSMELWAMVRGAWIMAREQGRDAGGALDFASAVVTKEWSGARVRDVSSLPLPAMTCAVGHASPAAWADHEFHHQWHAFVQRWCARLENELAQASKGSQQRQLLLVGDWPLISPADRDLAFLAQYEQIGPRVPWGGRVQRYDPYDNGRRAGDAVVLAVPEFAAERALAHAASQRGRLLAGPPLDEEDLTSLGGPDEPAARVLSGAHALLRTAYPLLDEDVARDGRRPRPTTQVREARAVLRARRGSEPPVHWAPQRQEDSRWRWKQSFREGQWIWVPDDTAAGPASQELRELTEPHAPHGVMRLIVATGARDDAALHVLYGALDGWDPRRRLLSFTARNTRHRLSVPVHRIVGLTGDRERRSHTESLWEEYTPPQAHQYYW
ncbi:hypothetical protein [Streptomyces sp. NPDC005538]|uniref:hypothetical protein n=1 Tax=Streptomyces sp. NPDC005538 TaxID=3157043 RepID=UPI0033A3B3F1